MKKQLSRLGLHLNRSQLVHISGGNIINDHDCDAGTAWGCACYFLDCANIGGCPIGCPQGGYWDCFSSDAHCTHV